MNPSSLSLVEMLLAHKVVRNDQVESAWRKCSAAGGFDLIQMLVREGALASDLADGLRAAFQHLVWRSLGPLEPEHALLRTGAVLAADLARVRTIREEVRKHFPDHVPSVLQVVLQLGVLTEDRLRDLLAHEDLRPAPVSAAVASAPVVARPHAARAARRASEAGLPSVSAAIAGVKSGPNEDVPVAPLARPGGTVPVTLVEAEAPVAPPAPGPVPAAPKPAAGAAEAPAAQPGARDFRVMLDFEMRGNS